MNAFPHLMDSIAVHMDSSVEKRIEICRADRWIGYEKAKSILDSLDQLVMYPTTQRPPCRVIVARADNGKTALLRQFQLRHKSVEKENGTLCSPVVRMAMPVPADLSQVWSEILTRCAVTHRRSDPAHTKYQMVLAVMRLRMVRVLAIDEFNDVALARKGAADILAGLRKLSNDLNISIVAAGTTAAVNALSFDAQMKSRFQTVAMPRWELDIPYLNFLNTYECLLPLARRSGLATEELSTALFALGEETIGGTVRLLKEAAILAITNGSEQITVNLIQAVKEARPQEDALADV